VSGFTLAPQFCGGTLTHPGDVPPAEYIWTRGPEPAQFAGTEIPLCASCCARWRQLAEQYPTQAPARIRSVPKTTLSFAPAGSDPDDPDAWTPLGYTDGITINWLA
jgi:hypothetical protein